MFFVMDIVIMGVFVLIVFVVVCMFAYPHCVGPAGIWEKYYLNFESLTDI